MRIEAIESLTSLNEDEAELLDEMLDEHPELDRESLVVYRISRAGRSRPLVAPANDALQVGMVAVSASWSETTQRASSDDPSERNVNLHLAPALVPDDLIV